MRYMVSTSLLELTLGAILLLYLLHIMVCISMRYMVSISLLKLTLDDILFWRTFQQEITNR